MTQSHQEALFYESLEEALRDVVRALGGNKVVGPALRPDKTPDTAANWLRDCLNGDRRETLHPGHVMWLLREGRQKSCHAAINYINRECGYEDARPVEPSDELAGLQRQFIDASHAMQKMAERIESLTQPALKRVA